MLKQRLIYVTANRFVVYDWLRDRLTASQPFQPGADGIAALVASLKLDPSIATFVLIDILEEQYVLGTLPHTTWRDRSEMRMRFAAKSFRGTPLRFADFQGRELTGRRDDRILGVAVSNPDTVLPLLNALKEGQIAIKGVASLPLATQDLLRLLPHRSSHILLVTPLASGLRLSFYEDRKLKLSRLTTVRDVDEAQRVRIICDEIDKTERYLGRMRILDGRISASVVILCDPDSYPFFIAKSIEDNLSRFVIINAADVVRGIPFIEDTLPRVNQVIAHIYLSYSRINHYADAALLRASSLYARVLQLRIGAGIVAALGVGAAAYAVQLGATLSDEGLDYAARTASLTHQAADIEKRLPATPMPPPQLRSAVKVVDELKRWRRTPTPSLLSLGGTLRQFSDVHVVGIHWRTVYPDEVIAAFDPNAIAPAEAETEAASTGDIVIREVTLLEGRLVPFDGNIKRAAERVNALAARLRLHTGVKDVSIVKAPVATRSSERTEGEIGGKNRASQADFTISITVEKSHAQPT